MAELDSASNVHDKSELNWCGGERQTLCACIYRCIYVYYIHMYICICLIVLSIFKI